MTMDTLTGVPVSVEDDTTAPQSGRGSGLGMTLLALGSLGIAGLALSRDPGVQAVVRKVAADVRVRAAAGELRKTVAVAWREHGGPEAMSQALRRGIKVGRPQ